MSFSFLKVSSCSPKTDVANIRFNLDNITICIDKAIEAQSKLIVFPELCITSYSCQDLFLQDTMLQKSYDAIYRLCDYSKDKDILIAVGAPLLYQDNLYNCAFIIFDGEILGIVPKSYIPNYSEFYEKRWFSEGLNIIDKTINLPFQKSIPFGTNLLFCCDDIKLGFEICEDLWVTIPPSSKLSLMGANIICNLSASNEIVSKAKYRTDLVLSQSARCMCAYVYSSAGVFESTTDLVFSGHLLIGENGTLLAQSNRFTRENEVISSIIDVFRLNKERLKNVSFRDSVRQINTISKEVHFNYRNTDIDNFNRFIDKHPFVPSDINERNDRCKEIFAIQIAALAKRLEHTNINKVIIGISGGLDSTLALLVAQKTFDMLNIPRENIITVTMPGFGTTDRTYKNATDLCLYAKTDLREINIVDSCLKHFDDIGHNREIHDVTYENVQARERTQLLMDIGNKERALVIGTGDLSELALGWCTYNGDHMSMYSVNCSIPKTLVRYLVKYAADTTEDKKVADTLIDILDTPVSPELLPKDDNGEIKQKTEDLIGPYELHDFFLYYFIKQGASKDRILFLANHAFFDSYDTDTIKKWLDVFIKRFFTQQFKRSALPDGPKVGSISLSPRGDFRMSSDVSFKSFI